jgi:hypothetical protein
MDGNEMNGIEMNAPACPYCGAAWTTAMLDMLNRYSVGAACACCVGQQHVESQHTEKPRSLIALPTQDLCCEHCGKPIYRAPQALREFG